MLRFIIIIILFSLSVCLCVAQTSVYALAQPSGVGAFELYKINSSNCTAVKLGNVLALDLAVTPNGQLWGTFGSLIFKIDSITADTTMPVSINFTSTALVDLNDSTLLLESGKNLYRINTRTGSMNSIGNIGYAANGDLAWYNNDLYMSSGGTLIKISLNSTNSAIVSAAPVHTSPPFIPLNYGMASVAYQGTDNYLLGSEYNHIIRLCATSGAFTYLCRDIVPGTILGLASKRPAPGADLSCTGSYVSINKESIVYPFLTIQPNPMDLVSEVLSSVNLDQSEIFLYNSHGTLVKKISEIRGKGFRIDREDLEAGLYYLVIRSADNDLLTAKLLIL